METLLAALQSAFPMREIPLGADAKLRVQPMTFELRQFAVEGVGNLSMMRGCAMLGLMRMETLILSPVEHDAPLWSYDRIRAMGNDTLISEWYDTFVAPPDEAVYASLKEPLEKLASVPAHDLGAHWYDSLKLPGSCARRGKRCDTAYRAYLAEAAARYIRVIEAAPAVDPAAKKARTAAYVNGLFEHGGPSTDAFVKALGRDRARALFDRAIFGVAQHHPSCSAL